MLTELNEECLDNLLLTYKAGISLLRIKLLSSAVGYFQISLTICYALEFVQYVIVHDRYQYPEVLFWKDWLKIALVFY